MAKQIEWREYLAEEDVDVPLHVLRYTCTERISWYLNKEVHLRSGMRHLPNYGGLGEKIGLDGLAITEMGRRDNPGFGIIDMWKQRRDLSPTIGNLVKYLAALGRQDILTDMADWIKEEIQIHREAQEKLEIQCEKVTSDTCREETDRILTIDDVVEGMAIYDAFISYDEADVDFVRAMIMKLEDPREFGFRFFVPGRNNLVGTNSNKLMTKIISERCRHMIVVLSPNFLKSPACDFQTAYAFSLSPGARDKKIVPIKIENCRTPDILQIMACCDFTNTNLVDWCWKRLATSIMCPMSNPDFLGPQRFMPPLGSALEVWGRVGMSETGGSGRSSLMTSRSFNPDSGFMSGNSRRGPATAPVSSNAPKHQATFSGAKNSSLTAPVLASGSGIKRNNSPGPVSAFQKFFNKTKKAKTPVQQTEPFPKSS